MGADVMLVAMQLKRYSVPKNNGDKMNTTDINRLIRWAVDTDGVKFAKEIYQRDEPDEYTRDKFRGMQTYLINWIANLDYKNRQRLADAINNHKEM